MRVFIPQILIQRVTFSWLAKVANKRMNEPVRRKGQLNTGKENADKKWLIEKKFFIGYTEKIIKNRLTHTLRGYKLPWYLALSSVCCRLEHSHWVGIGGKLNFWILSWKILQEVPINFK